MLNTPCVERYYRLVNFIFKIEATDVAFQPLLDGLYPECQIDTKIQRPVIYTLTSSEDGGRRRFSIRQNGRKSTEEFFSMDVLYVFLEAVITEDALAHQGDFIQLHAGAVCKDGEAVLFPADSGGGKTTLVISCVLAGFDCISDDIILVVRDSMEIRAFPRLLHIREGALPLFPHLKPRVLFRLSRYDEPCYYLERGAIRENCSVDIARPRAVVIPCYQPGSQTTLELIGQTEAASALIHQCINLTNRREHALHCLADLIGCVETYRLCYKDAGEAAALLADAL